MTPGADNPNDVVAVNMSAVFGGMCSIQTRRSLVAAFAPPPALGDRHWRLPLESWELANQPV